MESLRWRKSSLSDHFLDRFLEEALHRHIIATTHLRAIDIRLPCTTTNNIFTMLVSLTVGKVDAGVAVLLTEDKRLVSTDQPNAIDPVYGLLSGP